MDSAMHSWRSGERTMSLDSEPASAENVGDAMLKSLVIVLSDRELLDLYRVIIDRDGDGALAFLDQHVRKKLHQALEGG